MDPDLTGVEDDPSSDPTDRPDRTGNQDRRQTRRLLPDRPERKETGWLDRDRQPLVPVLYRRDQLRYAVDQALYTAKFHVFRFPLYLGWNVLWSFRGLARLTVGVVRWVRDEEHRSYELTSGDQAEALVTGWQDHYRIASQRRSRVRTRFWTAVGVAVLVLMAGFVALQEVQAMVRGGVQGLALALVLGSGLTLALVFALGWFGRPMDRPYIESAVVSAPKVRRITADMIITALHAAKLCKETIGPQAPEFAAPGVYRDGQGFGAVIDLPLGYTATQAIKRKQEIAAGLRVDEFRLYLEQPRGDGGHAGRIRMWISDDDPHTRPSRQSPLVKAQKFSIWDSVPFGTDVRGRSISFGLLWTSVLIGALPGFGKTTALRILLAAAALDPHVRLLAWDGKGGKDLQPLEQVAHAVGAGADDNVTKALLAALADLISDMEKRYARMRKLSDDVCPEGKVTPALSRDPKMKMPVTVVAIDEFQHYLSNKRYGNKIQEALITLAKLGRGAGIILLLSTQRPSSETIPTELRDVIGTRFCLKVQGREFSEMVLGSGSYSAGLDASKFLDSHLGVGILLGADDSPTTSKGGVTLRTDDMTDIAVFRKICDRAYVLREGAGTLSGVAAGEEDKALSDKILEHVVAAFQGEDKAHSDVLCARLAETHPGLYEHWDPNDLAAALGRWDIPTSNQIWAPRLEDSQGANRRGFHRAPIIQKITENTEPIPDSPPDDL